MTFTRPAWSRSLGVAIAAALIGIVLALWTAGPAFAHSSVDQTIPADGEVVATAPQNLVMAFNEVVNMAPGSVVLLDADGTETALPDPVVTPDNAGSRVVVGPMPALENGWYAYRWTAVSSDGHPVKGTFTFFVGDPEQASTATTVDTEQFQDPTEPMRRIAPFLRGLAYLAGMLALGSIVAAWAVSSPRAPMPDRVVSRVRRIAAASAVTGLVLAPTALVNNAIVLNGGSLESLGATAQLVLQSSTGASLLVRMSALFGVCTAVLLLVERSTRKIAYGAAIAAGAAFAVSFAMAGHAAVVEGKVAASIAEVAHLGAAALWVGAIPAIAVAVWSRRNVTVEMTAEAVDRFSRIATVSVLLVLVGGGVLTWQMFSEPDELFSTEYGLLLLAKIALVLLIAAMGAYNHFVLVPSLRRALPAAARVPAAGDPAGQDPGDEPAAGSAESPDRAPLLARLAPGDAARHLRATLLAEAVLFVLVLVATAALTSFAAPKAAGSHLEHEGLAAHAHSGGPGALDLDLQLALADLDPTVLNAPLGEGELEVSYLPGRSNAENRFTVRVYDSKGAPVKVQGVTLTFAQEERQLGPISREPQVQEDGSWVYAGRDLGVPGQWSLRVDVEVDEETIDFAELDVPIEGPRSVGTQPSLPGGE